MIYSIDIGTGKESTMLCTIDVKAGKCSCNLELIARGKFPDGVPLTEEACRRCKTHNNIQRGGPNVVKDTAIAIAIGDISSDCPH